MVEPRRSISETELDILKVLWEHGPGTVREVNALLRRQGRRWAYTTVLTLLQRLEAKGVVTSDKSGVAHVFRPAVTRQKLLRQRLKDLANQLCEGTATPLVQALVEGQRFTAEEISHFRQLLDEVESKKSKGGPGETRKGEEGPDA
jgi:BlaI family transcriptional regulator, penicillinase repressor